MGYTIEEDGTIKKVISEKTQNKSKWVTTIVVLSILCIILSFVGLYFYGQAKQSEQLYETLYQRMNTTNAQQRTDYENKIYTLQHQIDSIEHENTSLTEQVSRLRALKRQAERKVELMSRKSYDYAKPKSKHQSRNTDDHKIIN